MKAKQKRDLEMKMKEMAEKDEDDPTAQFSAPTSEPTGKTKEHGVS